MYFADGVIISYNKYYVNESLVFPQWVRRRYHGDQCGSVIFEIKFHFLLIVFATLRIVVLALSGLSNFQYGFRRRVSKAPTLRIVVLSIVALLNDTVISRYHHVI
jgi:hypothetical protein